MSPIQLLRRDGRGHLSEQRGQTLVEFALVLPLLLLLLFAIIDVGKAVSYWNDQTHLANEAARYVAVNGSPQQSGGAPVPHSLETAIKDQAVTPELKSGSGSSEGDTGITVSVCFPAGTVINAGGSVNAGQPVKVRVTSTYNWLGFLHFMGVDASSPMVGTSTMRLEKTYQNNATDSYTATAC